MFQFHVNSCYKFLTELLKLKLLNWNLSAPVTPGKRKAETKKDAPPTKKAKSEEGKKFTV